MNLFSYLAFPFKGLFRSINSYRFFTALQNNNTKKLETYLKSKRSLFQLEEIYTGLSPFHVLMRENKESLLPLLLSRPDAQSHINSQNNPVQWAPIHFAASNGFTPMLTQLLPLKPNLSIKTKDGLTPLHIAAGKNHIDFVGKLLDSGVHVNERSNNDWTALHFAASLNHVETCKFLMEKGAGVGLCDNNGLTALFSSVLYGHFEPAEFLYRFKESHKATSPVRLIHWAAGLPDIKIIEWLKSQGEDLWQVDSSAGQNSALHYAALGKSGACIKFLIKEGVPINMTDSLGSTALHVAVIDQDADIVKILCDNGAKPNLKNSVGLSPIDIAESLRNTRLESLLRKY